MTEPVVLPTNSSSHAERILLVAALLAFAIWMFLPPVLQNPAYHAFADQREWLGVPMAADVISNVAFLVIGTVGIALLASPRRKRFGSATEASLWCAALGFVCTAIGSAWYHFQPDDARLAWDRLPMTLIFGGILGTAVAQRVGQRAARVVLAALCALGPASIVHWQSTGDLSLYLMLQFGGIAVLLLVLATTRRAEDPFSWWWLIGWYALAKALEAGDAAIWQATDGRVAGHALKHLAAAMAGVALWMPLRVTKNFHSSGCPLSVDAARGASRLALVDVRLQMRPRLDACTAAAALLSTLMLAGASLAGAIEDAALAYDSGEYARALQIYRPLADGGDRAAQYRLGQMYAKGDGVPQDYSEAVRWYRRAADQGNASAQTDLGTLYDFAPPGVRRGAPQDYVEAVKWYRRAADQGLARAQNKLGHMYYIGKGVPMDWSEAIRWYRMAAEQGDAEGQYNLAGMYYRGTPIVKPYRAPDGSTGTGIAIANRDVTEAERWYRLAGDQGHAGAQSALSGIYAHRDRVEALKWNILAFEHWPTAEATSRIGVAGWRDWLVKKMTPEEIAEAEKRAREWVPVCPLCKRGE